MGREVPRWWAANRPTKRDLKADAVAGVPGAIAAIPEGMASGLLAGVSPIQGLYASLAGRTAGGLTSSTRLMLITTTSAGALAAASAVDDLDRADRAPSLFLLTAVAGVLMLAAGAAKLGRYTRFVSHSVMTGFLTGVAVNIVCSQLPSLVGADVDGAFPLAKAVRVLAHPSRIDLPSLAVGAAALVLLVALARTRIGVVGSLAALLVPTLAVVVLGLDDVELVSDLGAVPSGLPIPELPSLSLLTPSLLTGAAAVAAIVLVQGAGVAESVPSRDGRPADADGDFRAQGVANVASGLLSGTPVGGSVGQTAISVSSGARTRWAGIWSGLWLALVLLAFSGMVGKVAMPTLAAVLIVAAVRSLRLGQLATLLRTGQLAQIATVTTLLATLFLTVPAAVGIGVALSLALQLNREALDLTVVQLVPTGDHGWLEREAPATLPADDVVVLDVYGSLLFAGARTLQTRLPTVGDAEHPVVVLRLRGRTTLSATSMMVLAGYARQLAARGGRLYLSGVDPELVAQMRDGGRLHVEGPVQVFAARERIGASTEAALAAAEAWELRATTLQG